MKRVVYGVLAVVVLCLIWCHIAATGKAQIESKPFEFNLERMVLADSVINKSIAMMISLVRYCVW